MNRHVRNAITLIVGFALGAGAVYASPFSIAPSVRVDIYQKDAFTWPNLKIPEIAVINYFKGDREEYNPGYTTIEKSYPGHVIAEYDETCMTTDEAIKFMREGTWEIVNANIGYTKKLTVEAYELPDRSKPTIGTGKISCMEIPYESIQIPERIRVIDGKIAGVY